MNDLETTIREQQQRLKRYDNIDGTGEMFFGSMFLGFSLSTWLSPLFPPHSFWTGFPGTPLSIMLPVYGVLALAGWATGLIKRRITYRRTGYVLRRRDTKAVVLALVFAVGVSAALSAGVGLLLWYGMRHNAVSVTRLLLMSVYVAPYVFVTRWTTPEHRWKIWFAAMMALFSVAAFFSGWTMHVLTRATLSTFAVLWIASGLITLWLFVRHTQSAAQEDE